MKHQALFSLKDESKKIKIKVLSAAILLSSLRVNCCLNHPRKYLRYLQKYQYHSII